MEERLKGIVSDEYKFVHFSHFELFASAVCALELFVKVNWTGHSISDDDIYLAKEDLFGEELIEKVLVGDGESLVEVVKAKGGRGKLF